MRKSSWLIMLALVAALALSYALWPEQGQSGAGRSAPQAALVAPATTGATAEPGAADAPAYASMQAGLPDNAAEPASSLSLVPLGVYKTGVFDGSAAEILAYDAGSRRVFVTNAADNAVDILDIANPAAPVKVAAVDVSPYGDGPTSVDVHDGVAAIAVKGKKKTAPGHIVLVNSDGAVLAAVEAGVRPDSITFTPDGLKVLTANEGAPNDDYTKDPEGSVTIVDLAGGAAAVTQSAVTQVDFRAFNGMDLDPAIRIFGPGASVARDLEPEYVAVTPDSKRAYVTLQENNALAVIDIDAGLAVELIPLGFKDHSRPLVTGLRNYEIGDTPVVGQTPAGQDVRLGGFSGLLFEGVDAATGDLLFVTLTDRGPNADSLDLDGDGKDERPFALPQFSPRLVHLALNQATGTVSVRGETHLSRKDGTPLSGLPNTDRIPGAARDDEPAIDLLGRPLPYDIWGADPEAVARAADGSWWLGDEYRPSLFHFDADGRLLERYVPEGTNHDGVVMGVEALPAVLAQRQDNRGFEGLALEGSTLYAFMQSPVDNPPSDGDVNAESSRIVRVIAFDVEQMRTVGHYLYLLDGGEVDKLGDAVALGGGEFLVLERDSVIGPDARKAIYRVSLNGATNVIDMPDPGWEIMSTDQLLAAGVRPLQKHPFVDLTLAGYTLVDKPEGLALVDSNTVAVINDDDFGLFGTFDLATGALDDNPIALPSLLTLISLEDTALDPSDQDGGIHFSNPPVLGMFQPDAIAAYETGGETWLVTANEGDARAYKAFDEEVRVGEIALDPKVFPDAGELQRDENLGRLLTTNAAGGAGNDVDGDGLAERILAYGTRSIAIWDGDGNLVWESGDQIERTLASLIPEYFNSDADVASLDARSDDSGPEPEGLALGEVDGRIYAFVGLERMGGVMVFDVTEPQAAHWVTYATTRDFAGDAATGSAGDLSPEGVHFVAAEGSPTGTPLLLVANELSGTTRIFAIKAAP